MTIQELFDDAKDRVETARKRSRAAFKVYVDTQKKAFDLVFGNAQKLAKTEIGAAKEVYTSAKSSLTAGRETLVSAYRDTLDLLVKTGDDLSTIFGKGYRGVSDKLAGRKPAVRKTPSKRTNTAARTTTTRKKSTAVHKTGTAAATSR